MKGRRQMFGLIVVLALSAQATLTNPDFETGDYSGWTRTGNAWAGTPSSATWPSSGFHGSFHANSYFAGESATGTLRSATFTLLPGARVEFLMGGWRSVGVPAESNWNYVALCRAADETELARAYAPNITGAMTLQRLSPPLSDTTEVYLVVVDSCSASSFAWVSVDCFTIFTPLPTSQLFDFEAGTYTNWMATGTAWCTEPVTTNYVPWFFEFMGQHGAFYANSMVGGEAAMGTLRTINFTYESNTVVRFRLAGWSSYGVGSAGGGYNHVALRRAGDGSTITNIFAPNQTAPMVVREFNCPAAYGQSVYVEAVDNCPSNGFAWLAIDFIELLPTYDRLYGLPLAGGAERICGTMPFVATPNFVTTFTLNTAASNVYLLGMISTYDNGCTHWSAHPEMAKPRTDIQYIGNRIGTLRIVYADASVDTIPLDFGATIWSFEQWGARNAKEPFLTRPDCAAVFSNVFKLREADPSVNTLDSRAYFYLPLQPAAKTISRIEVQDNAALFGDALVCGVTLDRPASTNGLLALGPRYVKDSDRAPTLLSSNPGNWSNDLAALAQRLYTHDADLPTNVTLLEYPPHLRATKLLFNAAPGAQHFADMLSCMWMANIIALDEKFYAHNGEFHESGWRYPHYGSYSGIGTWAPLGIYYDGIFGRCSDHLATVALRCIDNRMRVTNYINYCDQQLYYYRSDHDPANGPPNADHDITRYPTNAPPHWSFVMSWPGATVGQINEIYGNEETDGHGATMVGRWVAWRHLGAPTSGWFTTPRTQIYGKSPWQATIDSSEFVCWLLDYTERDVVWCEGETTGWGGNGALVPPNMTGATTRAQIVTNYALAQMYEPYPAYLCLVGLQCSAQMADAMGDTNRAARWRTYAARIHKGLTNELTVSYNGKPAWRQSPYSVYPSFQDSLVPAWFAFYADGLDPNVLNPQLMAFTRTTFDRQIHQPWRHAQVLGMGYGQGWLTKAALLLDAMDDAGALLTNLAKYTYDKNMDYVDPARGIDWRLYQWIIPEGANLLPDGSWYRISDLGNGANQGIALHALELCAGIDDTHPATLKILPRVPAPLTGITVSNFPMLIPRPRGDAALARAMLDYSYTRFPPRFALTSSIALPTLAVRFGPYTQNEATNVAAQLVVPPNATVRQDLSGTYAGGTAVWFWVEGLTNVTTVTLPLPEPALTLNSAAPLVGLCALLHPFAARH
jgi:hypothetical protein